MIELHPDAKAAFDKRASDILSKAQIWKERDAKEAGTDVTDWMVPSVSGTISGENLKDAPVIQSRSDAEGNLTSLWITSAGRTCTLEGDACADLQHLADRLRNTGDLKQVSAPDTVLSLLAEWLTTAYSDKDTSATTYVLNALSLRIATFTVIVPIYELFVETPFTIGTVTIRPLKISEIDTWYSEWRRAQPQHGDVYDSEITRWKKKIAGRAVAECVVTAEPDYAGELALDMAETALGLLRIFSKGAFQPQSKSHCAVLGRENVESINYFLLVNGHIQASTSRILNGEGTFWRLDRAWIEEILHSGLNSMSGLLLREPRTQFQQVALDALLLYSRCATEGTIEGKLIYLFASLESVLLRNEHEPIQDNVAHRLAYTIRKSIVDRKHIVRTVKAAYALRSKFFHHGITVTQRDVVGDAMQIAWVFFAGLAALAQEFDTKDRFLQHLEDRRLSG